MKAKDLPERYKIYVIKLVSGDEYRVNGEELIKIIKSSIDLIKLKNGSGFNKKMIVNWFLDKEITKENFLTLPERIRNEIGKKIIKVS